MSKPIHIQIYRWAGHWGPFKVKIPCGECALSIDIIQDTLTKELAGIPVKIDDDEWLTNWWKPLLKGGWHAPMVLVEGTLISQGKALNRGVLTQAVIDAHAKRTPLTGNHLFGKENCQYCHKAKTLLNEKQIDFTYHDVIADPRALYEMLARVKPLIGAKTPVTVPQIWLDSKYIGGCDELEANV